MTDYRVLVTGSRNWSSQEAIHAALDGILAEHEPLTVIHGACPRGADRHAQNWALSQRYAPRFVTPEPHPADWQQYGRQSGYLRNEAMVKAGADLCLAFVMPCRKSACARKTPHGSHGTEHCAGLAEQAGIEVRRFTP